MADGSIVHINVQFNNADQSKFIHFACHCLADDTRLSIRVENQASSFVRDLFPALTQSGGIYVGGHMVNRGFQLFAWDGRSNINQLLSDFAPLPQNINLILEWSSPMSSYVQKDTYNYQVNSGSYIVVNA